MLSAANISCLRNILFGFFAFVFIIVCNLYAGADGVSQERLQRLAKGTNLPGWLWLNRGEPQALETRYSDETLQLIRSLGFTHVRIPIDMANAHEPEDADLLSDDLLLVLDAAIENLVQKYNLAVIIDLHSISQDTGGSNYSGPLATDPDFVDTYVEFWSAFAKHLSKHDPDWVFLEPMNEPVFNRNEAGWIPIQNRVIRVIRENAPEHTIFATGARWSNIDTLIELEPLDDSNIVYNFHFYEPHIFTHQGATWSSEFVKPLREIPYPSSPEIIAPFLEKYQDEEVKKHLTWYGKERWNTEQIREEIGKAAAWGKEHNVPLICDEFGVYRNFSPRESREQWYRDVRSALEENRIGWTVWSGGFGIFYRENRENRVDKGVAEALGLMVE
ncbi:MAG: glycoside hydrolase family 5 protein [bacterium]